MYDIINTEHKARKTHTCCLCGCPIEIGEKYIRQFQQDSRSTLKMHNECVSVLSELSEPEDYDEGVSTEDFCNRITNYVYDNHSDMNGVIEEGWNGSVYKQVKMIVKELEEEK